MKRTIALLLTLIMVFASISMSVSASGVSEQDNGNTLSVMEFTTKFKNEPINTGILDEPLVFLPRINVPELLKLRDRLHVC